MNVSLRGAVLGTACAVIFAACSSRDATDGEHGAGFVGHERTGGEVVATVDGVAIRRGEVEELMRELHVSAREAVDSLIAERLLASRAQRRGVADDPEVIRATRQALVQALLAREVEAVVLPSSIPAAEVDRYYEAERRKFVTPDRRGSTHVLAQVSRTVEPQVDGAARRVVEEALADYQAHPGDPEAWRMRWDGRAGHSFQVVAQDVPPFGEGDDADPAYVAALRDAPGINTAVPRVVRSDFGWHAIVVTSFEPANTVSREQADAVIRNELVMRMRNARMHAFIEQLRTATPIHRDEAAWAIAQQVDVDDEAQASR